MQALLCFIVMVMMNDVMGDDYQFVDVIQSDDNDFYDNDDDSTTTVSEGLTRAKTYSDGDHRTLNPREIRGVKDALKKIFAKRNIDPDQIQEINNYYDRGPIPLEFFHRETDTATAVSEITMEFEVSDKDATIVTEIEDFRRADIPTETVGYDVTQEMETLAVEVETGQMFKDIVTAPLNAEDIFEDEFTNAYTPSRSHGTTESNFDPKLILRKDPTTPKPSGTTTTGKPGGTTTTGKPGGTTTTGKPGGTTTTGKPGGTTTTGKPGGTTTTGKPGGTTTTGKPGGTTTTGNPTGSTTPTTRTTTTVRTPLKSTIPKFDIEALLDIVSNLTYDYDTNLTLVLNETLQKYSIPTCPTPTTTEVTTVETTTEEDRQYAPVVAKCFVCGLEDPGIPHNAWCADAFATDFLPLVPIDAKAKGKIARFRKYCRYEDINNYRYNHTDSRGILGRWTGGCAVRWIDLSGVYTQRTCRSRYQPTTGLHFASKRMAKLELALSNVDNGCIISPMATLIPLSRGISLYARFHACVCSGSWCNRAISNAQWSTNIIIVFLVFVFCMHEYVLM